MGEKLRSIALAGSGGGGGREGHPNSFDYM